MSTGAHRKPVPILLASSGGKDSLLALARLRAAGGWDVRALLSAFVAPERVLLMHEVPEQLMEAQAASLGIALVKMHVPRQPSNAMYEERLESALAAARAQGIRHIAFGDLFLADIRAYRDRLMAKLGVTPVYPLWGEPTAALGRHFVAQGYRAVTVCVDAAKLDPTFAGRQLDAAFFAALPAGVDPCGENGEYHSFVYDGPGFAFPVPFAMRVAAACDPAFHRATLSALPMEACAHCGAPFTCGEVSGAPSCWCAALPAIPPIDPASGCLCPRCLASLSASSPRARPPAQ